MLLHPILLLFLSLVHCDESVSTSPLDASKGHVLPGPELKNNDYGTSVSCIGDVNGDSIPDYAFGLPSFSSGRGMVTIVYGTYLGGGIPDFNFGSSIGSQWGYTIYGEKDGDLFGAVITMTGALTSSNTSSFAISAPGASTVYIIMGSAGRAPPQSFQIDTSSGRSGYDWGFLIKTTDAGGAGSLLGFTVASTDANNDGQLDIIIGAPLYQESSVATGRVFILYGPLNLNADIKALLQDGTSQQGFYLYGNGNNALLGLNLATLRLTAGSTGLAVTQNNAVYVFDAYLLAKNGAQRFGIASATVTVSSSLASMTFGQAIATGPLHYSTFDDLCLTATTVSSGAVYCLLNNGTLSKRATVDLATFSAATGVKMVSSKLNNNDRITLSIGKFTSNNKGLADLSIGLPSDTSSTGKVFIVTPANTAFELSLDTPSSIGLKTYTGAATQDRFGTTLAVGQANNLGFLLVGSPGYDSSRGAVYYLFGSCTAGHTFNSGVCVADSQGINLPAWVVPVVACVSAVAGVALFTLLICHFRAKRRRRNVQKLKVVSIHDSPIA